MYQNGRFIKEDNTAISTFIKENSQLDIVIEMQEANSKGNVKKFTRCLNKIKSHINAVDQLKLNLEDWKDCGCADYLMWIEECEKDLIFSEV